MTPPFPRQQHHSYSNVQKKNNEFFQYWNQQVTLCPNTQSLLAQKPTLTVVANQKHNQTMSV